MHSQDEGMASIAFFIALGAPDFAGGSVVNEKAEVLLWKCSGQEGT